MNLLERLFSTQYMVRDDLRHGELTPTKEAYRLSMRIAFPAMVEMFSVAVMGMVSTAMVGRLGPYAVAAVGLTGQPRMIFTTLFIAMNTGVTAIVSRRKGQDDQASAQTCVRQALLVGFFLAIAMSVLASLTAEPLMWFAGAQSDTIGASSEYFRIVSMGLIFQTLSLTICAAQRGVGNTRITMICNLAANITNIVLSYLLIGGNHGFPRLEVRGAAIATVSGFAVGFALVVFSLFRKDAYLRISFKDDWKPDIPMLHNIMRIGGGAMVEQLALRVGFFAYARIVADLGTNSFAAHQIATQLLMLSFTFSEGIGAATTSLVGQNLGKKRPDLAIMYGKIGQRIAFIIAVIISIGSIAGRHSFAFLFTDDRSIVDMTAVLIIIIAAILPIQTSHIVMSGTLRGAGDVKYVALTMLITVTLIRPIFSAILIYGFGFGLTGAWYALACDQVVRAILLLRRFSQSKWIDIAV